MGSLKLWRAAWVLALGATFPMACKSSDDNPTGAGGSSASGGSGKGNDNATCSAVSKLYTGSGDCKACKTDACKDEQADYCAANCGADSSTMACRDAADIYDLCATIVCYDECKGDTTDTGNGGTGGSSGTSGSGGTGGAEPDDAVPGDGGAGQSGLGIGAINTYCYQAADGVCKGTAVPAAFVNLNAQQCTAGGGVAGPCPTANLLGCCILGAFENCYYPAAKEPSTESTCGMSGGAWSKVPQ